MAIRDESGKFAPGSSGNPHGAPKGPRTTKATEIRKMIEKEGPALVRVVMKAAKAGDLQSAIALLDRIVPRLRAEAAPVNVDLSGASTEIASRLLAAVSESEMTPETAADLLALVKDAQPPASEPAALPDTKMLDEIYEKAMQNAEAERAKVANRRALLVGDSPCLN
ncbi:hypothetical protein Thivi_4608 [Thiocystis violascens DSM 198]|uniref:DUF5681 domain-containing protein n=2 Tax=Thiocystis violascens TaxID=73141 RepID=I3YHD1_THIV6|nr:hypothetical protein Thivi_4608 [Thiocystis violascens DSM 198]